MKFWDASAIVPLILSDSAVNAGIGADDKSPMCVWWATIVEAVSAITRRERAGALTGEQVQHCLDRLRELSMGWMEVPPSDALRDSAQRLLRIHALRAADSLQLAAALATADGRARSVEFVCCDLRLSEAASREGLTVIAT
ncbi:MAG: PIN domain-containing protein [Pseudomonadota bacterium]|nr:PIN domain-containing protein [Pseudomonadota bacterium]